MNVEYVVVYSWGWLGVICGGMTSCSTKLPSITQISSAFFKLFCFLKWWFEVIDCEKTFENLDSVHGSTGRTVF